MEFSPELLKRLSQRDEEAFGKVYKYMVDRLYRYTAGRYRIDRATIYDIISDFFVKLRNRIDRIDPKQAFEAWIWTIYRNFLIDYFKAYKQTASLSTVEERVDDTILQPGQHVQISYQVKQIYAVIDQLDDLSKEVVLLRYVEQLGFEEIAVIT